MKLSSFPTCFADIEFEAIFSTGAAFYAFLNQLRTDYADMITSYDTTILATFYRLTYLPPDPHQR